MKAERKELGLREAGRGGRFRFHENCYPFSCLDFSAVTVGGGGGGGELKNFEKESRILKRSRERFWHEQRVPVGEGEEGLLLQ